MDVHTLESDATGLELNAFPCKPLNLMLYTSDDSFIGIRDPSAIFCQEGDVGSNKDHDEMGYDFLLFELLASQLDDLDDMVNGIWIFYIDQKDSFCSMQARERLRIRKGTCLTDSHHSAEQKTAA